MAGSVNKVTLIGNLGRDPEIRATQNGSKVVNMTLATGEAWTDKATGERKEKTEWHRIVVFSDRLADVAEKYYRKGDKVFIEGALQTRKWTDQSGAEKYTTEIVLTQYKGEMVKLSGKADDAGEEAPQASARPAQSRAARSAPPMEDLDDEIPF